MTLQARLLATACAVGAMSGVATAQPSTDAALAPPAAPPMAPPPPAHVVEFLSTTAMPWEVQVDRQPTCTTPCRIQLDTAHWITMRTREDRPLRMEVGNVGGVPARVTATDLSTGKYATGITFTTVGGMAVVTGIVLTAVGCSGDHDGMCKAGLITGGAGALVTVGGIWLIRSSLPRVRVKPFGNYELVLAPSGRGGAIAGTF